MKRLATVDEVIAVLGGRTSTAELTCVVPTAVSNWKRAGRFAPNTYLVMMHALHDADATAPPSLWGMKASPRTMRKTAARTMRTRS